MLGASPYNDDPIRIPPGARLIRRIRPRSCDCGTSLTLEEIPG